MLSHSWEHEELKPTPWVLNLSPSVERGTKVRPKQKFIKTNLLTKIDLVLSHMWM